MTTPQMLSTTKSCTRKHYSASIHQPVLCVTRTRVLGQVRKAFSKERFRSIASGTGSPCDHLTSRRRRIGTEKMPRIHKPWQSKRLERIIGSTNTSQLVPVEKPISEAPKAERELFQRAWSQPSATTETIARYGYKIRISQTSMTKLGALVPCPKWSFSVVLNEWMQPCIIKLLSRALAYA